MSILLLALFFLFLIYGLLRIIFRMLMLLKSYLDGDIQLSIEEKQEMKKSFWDGIKILIRHLFLLK